MYAPRNVRAPRVPQPATQILTHRSIRQHERLHDRYRAGIGRAWARTSMPRRNRAAFTAAYAAIRDAARRRSSASAARYAMNPMDVGDRTPANDRAREARGARRRGKENKTLRGF